MIIIDRLLTSMTFCAIFNKKSNFLNVIKSFLRTTLLNSIFKTRIFLKQSFCFPSLLLVAYARAPLQNISKIIEISTWLVNCSLCSTYLRIGQVEIRKELSWDLGGQRNQTLFLKNNVRSNGKRKQKLWFLFLRFDSRRGGIFSEER